MKATRTMASVMIAELVKVNSVQTLSTSNGCCSRSHVRELSSSVDRIFTIDHVLVVDSRHQRYFTCFSFFYALIVSVNTNLNYPCVY